MKLCIRQLGKDFSLDELRDSLLGDPDFEKLLGAASASTPHGNLAYWVKTGKLSRDGDRFRITEKDFFEPAV